MHVLGIDPGVSGGAVLLEDGLLVDFAKWEGEETFITFLKTHADVIDHVFIEKVHGTPVQTAGRAFTFGENAGFIRGAVMSFDLPFTLVPPQRWQSGYNFPKVPRTAKGKTEHKNNVKKEAARLIPGNWTHATADAALIAKYGIKTISSSGRPHSKAGQRRKKE